MGYPTGKKQVAGNRPVEQACATPLKIRKHAGHRGRWRLPLLAGAAATVFAGAALAQGGDDTAKANQTFADKFMNQVVKGTVVHGRIGIYDFRRWHDTNQPYPGQEKLDNKTGRLARQGDNFNTEGTNYGAQIQLHTGAIYGFSLGGAFVYESSFYGNNSDDTKLNCNLAGGGCGGNGGSVTNITQGFLQFNSFGAQIRAGRQLLNTPFANADQFTFLPRSFNGITGVIRPLDMFEPGGLFNQPTVSMRRNLKGHGPLANKTTTQAPPESFESNQYLPFQLGAPISELPGWQLFGGKINRYEGRGNSSKFVRNNRYFNNVDGFWFAGTAFNDNTPGGQVIAQYYHYHFDQTENVEYGELGYMTPEIGSGAAGFAPYIRGQAVYAHNVNNSRVKEGIHATIYGLKLGIESQYVQFAIFGNFSPEHGNSFNHGQFLHPYSDLSGVLYTDTMNDGISEIGPGWAAGGRVDFTPNDDFAMYVRYVQYKAKHGHYHDFYFTGGDGDISDASFTGDEVDNQKSHAIGIGFTYDLGGLTPQLAGLKINDNLGYTHFDGAPNFYDNRVRFYYSF